MGNITQLHMIGVPNKLELEEHPYISTVEEPHVCSIKLQFYGSTPFSDTFAWDTDMWFEVDLTIFSSANSYVSWVYYGLSHPCAVPVITRHTHIYIYVHIYIYMFFKYIYIYLYIFRGLVSQHMGSFPWLYPSISPVPKAPQSWLGHTAHAARAKAGPTEWPEFKSSNVSCVYA
jgi:hypothetical protein